jgi:hypothetical protein
MAEARENAVGNVLSQESINKSAELWEMAVATSLRARNCYRLVTSPRRGQPDFSRPLRRRLKRRWRLYRKVLHAEYGSDEAIEKDLLTTLSLDCLIP